MARAKGCGTLVKRGNVYQARWVVDGQVFTRSTKCTNRKEALERLSEFVHPYQVSSDIETLANLETKIKVLEGEANRTPKDKAIRLKLLLDTYVKDVNQSPITEATDVDYTCKLNRFIKHVAPKEYAYQVTEADADGFMLTIKAKCTEKTFNSYLKVLKRVFTVAMRHDTNIRKNPFSHLKELKVQIPSYRRELTNEEISRLLDEAKKIGHDEWLLFMLGTYSGLRRGDCLDLRLSEIDFDNRMIRRLPRKTTKTGRVARIPIVNELYDALKGVEKGEGDFVLRRIHSYSHWQISNLVEKVFKNAGIEIFRLDKDGKKHFITGFHSLRHTVASKLHRNGTPINQIRTILGHTKVDMSLAYAHIEESDLKMPDFTDSTKEVRISKGLHSKVMGLARGEETFEDVVRRLVERRFEDSMRIAEIQEAKRKESEEIDRLVDEVLSENVTKAS